MCVYTYIQVFKKARSGIARLQTKPRQLNVAFRIWEHKKNFSFDTSHTEPAADVEGTGSFYRKPLTWTKFNTCWALAVTLDSTISFIRARDSSILNWSMQSDTAYSILDCIEFARRF